MDWFHKTNGSAIAALGRIVDAMRTTSERQTKRKYRPRAGDIVGVRLTVDEVDDGKLKTMYAVEKYGQSAAMKLVQAAKDEAPWTDRTGLARQTIAPVSDWAGDTFRIGVAGNMNYSPYLEKANDERYAVLWPTIHRMAPEILRGMRDLL